ncbi:hypothetical protein ACWGQ5_27665 [Streptomyces sp. NPDC055722]
MPGRRAGAAAVLLLAALVPCALAPAAPVRMQPLPTREPWFRRAGPEPLRIVGAGRARGVIRRR